jgi:PAS domain S-box-containing protein
MLMDKTEGDNSQEALRTSEAGYRELFERNPQPMWVYDQETLAFLRVNDAAIAHYGYSREEFLAMTIRDIRPPEDVSRLLENVSAGRSGLSQAELWRHRRKDGSDILVEIAAHSVTDWFWRWTSPRANSLKTSFVRARKASPSRCSRLGTPSLRPTQLDESPA